MKKSITSRYFDQEGNLFLRPYRLKDLAIIFGVTRSTLETWIDHYREEIGKRKKGYYSIQQVKVMVEKFGLPENNCVQLFSNSKQAA